MSQTLQYKISPYYKYTNFYTLKSSKTLHILESFKTYQQTSNYTCGCACLIMTLHYLGKTKISERECARISDTGTDLKNSTHGIRGLYPDDLARAFNYYGFKVLRNTDYETLPFHDEASFRDFVIESIDNKQPIVCLVPDWGGHYLTIIGVDTMGNSATDDDVLIVADPYDTTDHVQDGYVIWSLERFYALWKVSIPFFMKDFDSAYNFMKVVGRIDEDI